jgi:BMFP domain-containing protein YqiC
MIDDVSKKLAELATKTPLADLEKNARTLLSSLMARADLITREEFDRQTELLGKTRQRLSDLEDRIKQLEEQKIRQT